MPVTFAQLGPQGVQRLLQQQEGQFQRQERKHEMARRACVVAERYTHLIQERILHVYDKARSHTELIKYANSGVNVMLRTVRELAFVYQRPPLRRLNIEGPIGIALNERLNNAHKESQIAKASKQWGQYAFAMNVIWVIPGVWAMQDGMKLGYTMVLPHRADRIYSDNQKETDILIWERDAATSPNAAAEQAPTWMCHPGAATQGFMVLDSQALYWTDNRFNVERVEVHGIGAMPAVEMRVSEPPPGDFWDIGRGHKLLDATVECGRVAAAMGYVRRSQNRKLVTMFGGVADREQIAAPEAAVTATGDADQISFSVHDFETTIDAFKDEMRWHIEQAVESYGVPITTIDPEPASTGDAVNVFTPAAPQLHASRAELREDQIEYARPSDRELAVRSHQMMTRFGHPQSINPEVIKEAYEATWSPMTYIDNPMNQLEVLDRKVSRGYLSPAMAVQELFPGMTEADALKFILNNLEQKARIDMFHAQHNLAPLLQQNPRVMNPAELQGRLGGQTAAENRTGQQP